MSDSVASRTRKGVAASTFAFADEEEGWAIASRGGRASRGGIVLDVVYETGTRQEMN